MQTKYLALGMLSIGTLTGVGCSDGSAQTTGEGDDSITAYGEDFIEHEIPASDTDGWAITFSSFEVTFSDISATNDDGEQITVDDVHTVDLTEPTAGQGQVLAELAAPAGLYNSLNYRVGPVDSQPALHIVGSATKDQRTVQFDWSFQTDTQYENCQTSAMVAAGGQATSQLTIHADHLFYDDLVSSEPNIAFELIAASDTNDDGTVTLEELGQTDISAETRYQVGSRDVHDLRAFIAAQTATVGHIDGEGHCE